MKIEYFGHSCFRLTDSAGTSVITDPYDSSIGYAMPKICANAVTVSHHHYDHDNVGAVGGNPVVFDRARDYEINAIKISGIKSFHDEVRGAKRGENIIFKFFADGLTVCHLGDLGEPCSDELVNKIGRVDVLLIPVGGTYTVDAAAAKEYADKINAGIVIPMHYKTRDCNLDISGADKFTALYGGAEELCGSLELDGGSCGGVVKVILLRRK